MLSKQHAMTLLCPHMQPSAVAATFAAASTTTAFAAAKVMLC